MSTAAKAPKRTPYRVSPPVDEWVKGEAERLGISRNAVVEMKLSALMTTEAQPFTAAQRAEIESLIVKHLEAHRNIYVHEAKSLEKLTKADYE